MASPFLDTRRGTWSVRLRWPLGRKGTQKTVTVDNEKQARDGAGNANRLISALKNPQVPFSIPENVENVPEWLVSGGNRGFRQVKASSAKPSTVRGLVDLFLDFRKSQIGSGEDDEISSAMYMDDYYQLTAFAQYCENRTIAEILTTDFLREHRKYLINEIRTRYGLARGQGGQASFDLALERGED